ncbi:MAG: hypothetical protein FWG98_10845 [Candidatus Cloacimonetes bacterium]|nr:hypothetical protein [Candidatus Cloacimonadota bacterium]
MKIQNCKIRQIVVLAMILLMGIMLEPITISDPFKYEAPRVREHSELRWPSEIVRPFEVRQPDGTLFSLVVIHGGENNVFGSIFQKDGYTIAKNDETGYWVWVQRTDGGWYEPTGYPVHLYDPEELGLEKNIRVSSEIGERWLRTFSADEFFYINMRTDPFPIITSPSEGDVNMVVIYVSLADQDTTHVFPESLYQEKFEVLTTYYHDVSYGKLNITPY